MGSAEIISAPEGIDEGKVLREVATTLFLIAVELNVVFDTKDLVISLTTQKVQLIAPFESL